jgi:outer membrane protein OmpA-like peptidoglycan-associated protein
LVPSVALTLDYAHEPFVIVGCPSETECDFDDRRAELSEYQFTTFLSGAVTLYDRFQVGLVVPVALTSSEGFADTTATGEPLRLDGGVSFGLGDPRLSVKASLYDQGGEGLEIAAMVFGTAPLGQATAEGAFIGDDGPTFGGQAIAEYRQAGFRAAVNFGGFWRGEEQLFSTAVGSQLTYGVGAGYEITPLASVFGEIYGSAGFSSQVDEHQLEGRAGAKLRLTDFELFVAGGGALVSGVGMPVFRVTAGGAWRPERGDSDDDGVSDRDDACPSAAEDMDQFQDEDGCPDPDNDQDGIADGEDACPLEAEDFDEYEDEDGCPDRDNDGDGVSDGFDSCPNKPEDKDGDRDDDGCPDADTDRDGIPDSEDQCPNEPEDTDGFGDLDGCPEDDFDLDGIPDDEDHCPDQPEVFNGYEDSDGCPEEDSDADGKPDAVDQCPERGETYNDMGDADGCPDGKAAVEFAGDGVRLLMEVDFRGRTTRLTGRSRRILNALADLLQYKRHLRHVRIEGHAAVADDAERNRALGQERAEAVATYLERRGVDASRLVPVGIGDEQPAEGEPANRIEVHVEPVTPGSETAGANEGDGGSSEPAEAAPGT